MRKHWSWRTAQRAAPAAAMLLAALPAPAVQIDTASGPVQEKAGCLGAWADFCNLRICQAMVEAFVDGDPDHDYGDGYGTSHHKGDLRGIIESLDYIRGPGMNAIWLTPVFDSDAGEPQERLGGAGTDLKLDATGYCTRNYFAMDPKFGTLEDARELVEKAHAKDMYVFFDAMFGHHKGGLAESPTGRRPVDSVDPADYGGDPSGYPGRVVDYGAPQPAPTQSPGGTIRIEFHGCDSATLQYDIDTPPLSGVIELQRLAPDNVPLCEALAAP